jgi:hypothetical protein
MARPHSWQVPEIWIKGSVNNMKNDKKIDSTTISKANTLEDIGDFWDSHSLADHWDETHEVMFDVRAQRRRRITIDPELYSKVEAQARTRGILPETLVNMWLSERLKDSGFGSHP